MNLNLLSTEQVLPSEEGRFELALSNSFPEDKESKIFAVGFKLGISNQAFGLDLEAIFHFELVEGELSEEFKTSSFPKVNAPAIAFPYLRAFVSNLTLQSGLNPVMLPSINFIKLAEGTNSL